MRLSFLLGGLAVLACAAAFLLAPFTVPPAAAGAAAKPLLIAAGMLAPTAALAADTSATTVDVSGAVQFALSYAGTILMATAMWGLRKLPASIYSLVLTFRVEQLLERGIGYGINAVAGAVKDKPLPIHVGSEVIATALRYILSNAPAMVVRFAGGPDALKAKIFARLNLVPEASAPAVGVKLQT